MGSFYRRFNNSQQHDAYEFLTLLLDGLHEDLNAAPAAKGERLPETMKDPDEVFAFNNQSRIIDIFHGRMRSQIEFPACRHQETREEPLATWEVAMPRLWFWSSCLKLESCTKEYVKEETLSGANKPLCSVCDERKEARRRTTIVRVGQVLIIVLKRFSGSGARIAKNNTAVTYPGVLELEELTETQKGRYTLTGVVFHTGSLQGGHYVAAAMDTFGDAWYHFDDSRVRQIPEKDAHQGNAYILFYQALE
jgi:ubiquitin carboxyl-terminal hydrolase 2/21